MKLESDVDILVKPVVSHTWALADPIVGSDHPAARRAGNDDAFSQPLKRHLHMNVGNTTDPT